MKKHDLMDATACPNSACCKFNEPNHVGYGSACVSCGSDLTYWAPILYSRINGFKYYDFKDKSTMPIKPSEIDKIKELDTSITNQLVRSGSATVLTNDPIVTEHLTQSWRSAGWKVTTRDDRNETYLVVERHANPRDVNHLDGR